MESETHSTSSRDQNVMCTCERNKPKDITFPANEQMDEKARIRRPYFDDSTSGICQCQLSTVQGSSYTKLPLHESEGWNHFVGSRARDCQRIPCLQKRERTSKVKFIVSNKFEL